MEIIDGTLWYKDFEGFMIPIELMQEYNGEFIEDDTSRH